KEILSAQHPRIKEIMIERYGLGNLVEALGYIVLDEVKVEKFVYQLLSVDIEESAPIVVLKVTCPSTKKKYYLRVPSTYKKFQEALAWTFGIHSADLYRYFET
ncbi:MAG: DUF6745 domain-containing protein, partial [Ignavibacterium sp.]